MIDIYSATHTDMVHRLNGSKSQTQKEKLIIYNMNTKTLNSLKT